MPTGLTASSLCQLRNGILKGGEPGKRTPGQENQDGKQRQSAFQAPERLRKSQASLWVI